jgi:ComF family protein
LPFDGDISNNFVCSHCQDLDLKFCWARSAALAEGTVLDAIHKYKYNRRMWFEGFLAELLISAAADGLKAEAWDALIPIPLFPVKEREREFNQAERLARRLGAATGIPVDCKVIQRVLPTKTQTRLSREERSENMRGAFAMHKRAACSGRQYVLIDDVFTTGATTNACAKVLLKAGAARVAVWTVARAVTA